MKKSELKALIKEAVSEIDSHTANNRTLDIISGKTIKTAHVSLAGYMRITFNDNTYLDIDAKGVDQLDVSYFKG